MCRHFLFRCNLSFGICHSFVIQCGYHIFFFFFFQLLRQTTQNTICNHLTLEKMKGTSNWQNLALNYIITFIIKNLNTNNVLKKNFLPFVKFYASTKGGWMWTLKLRILCPLLYQLRYPYLPHKNTVPGLEVTRPPGSLLLPLFRSGWLPREWLWLFKLPFCT